MLTQIHIKNFTIVSELNVDFHAGFNVLTGETGAGKSISIDAMQIALGHRADSNLIRSGEEYCDITLIFEINNNMAAKNWLEENEFPNEECFIRRRIYANRSSRSSINGSPCPLHLIRQLASFLMNIHGQHQHQTLLKSEGQRERLDQYANNGDLLNQIAKYYETWHALNKELELLTSQENNRDAELSFLEYQYDELITLSLQDDEWKTLTQQHQRLHQAKQLLQELNEAIDLTVDNEQVCATQLVQQIIDRMELICKQDPELNSTKSLLETAAIHLKEAGDELNHYRNAIDLSPENLQVIEQRLTQIHDLARKHHVHPKDLHDIEKSLSQKIMVFKNIDSKIAELHEQQKNIEAQYQKSAHLLSEKRKTAAKKLNQSITQMIRQLGMQEAEFVIKMEQIKKPISLYGNESIHFEIKTNRGQTFQPLNSIVSGGELSRIGLAIQVASATKDDIPTLIFDEVDTGIGGKTASMVGELLHLLGQQIQVLCITHLPQIAAKAHHHYKVEKSFKGNQTYASISELNHNKKIDELSRMLGGNKITEQTRIHANELLTLKE